jgi:hypothetical protein
VITHTHKIAADVAPEPRGPFDFRHIVDFSPHRYVISSSALAVELLTELG